jgi:hypothetical protein
MQINHSTLIRYSVNAVHLDNAPQIWIQRTEMKKEKVGTVINKQSDACRATTISISRRLPMYSFWSTRKTLNRTP